MFFKVVYKSHFYVAPQLTNCRVVSREMGCSEWCGCFWLGVNFSNHLVVHHVFCMGSCALVEGALFLRERQRQVNDHGTYYCFLKMRGSEVV